MTAEDAPAADETIGQRLKRLRLEQSLSQRELAAPGVSYAYISRLEAGTRQPSVKALRKLAVKLGVTADYLETGADIGPADSRELRVVDLELAVRLGNPEGAEAASTALLDEAVAAGDKATSLRCRVALAALNRERGSHDGAIAFLEAALEDEPPPPARRFDIYSELGRAYAATGRPDRAVDLFETCLNHVSTTTPTDPTVEARYATLLSYALSDAGDLTRAEQIIRDALRRVRGHEDPYTRIRLYWSLARLEHAENRPIPALASARKAIALLETTEDMEHLARAHLLAASIAITRSEPDEAAAHLDIAERILGRPSLDDSVMIAIRRAQTSALNADGEAAERIARGTLELMGERLPIEQGAAYLALGDGLALQNKVTDASEAYRRALELLEENRQWREATQAGRNWARLLRESGREREALDVLERATELSMRIQRRSTRVAR
ncbi:MAG: helix-turn-helix domain-containing protein [Gaiellaceae bacterium]